VQAIGAPRAETSFLFVAALRRVICSTLDTLMVPPTAFVGAVLKVEELTDNARMIGIAVRVETFLTPLRVGLSAIVLATALGMRLQ
jgi:hypothetical protein